MGQAAFARDQYGDAVRAYEAALNTDANSIAADKALYKLGFAYIRNQNWTEGRRRLRQLTDKYPDSLRTEEAADVLAMTHDVFQLKCGSFATVAGLDGHLAKLRSMNLAPVVVPITRQGMTQKSVRVGSYTTFAEARAAADALRARGVNCFIFP